MRRPVTFLALAVVLGGPALGLAQPRALTLQQAVSEALARNEQLIDQADATAEADLDLRLARSAFYPKVVPSVFGSFGQTDVASQHYRLDVAQRLTTGTEMRVSVGTATSQIPGADGRGDVRFYNADTTLLLTQPLLRGFGTKTSRRALTSAELRQTLVRRKSDAVRRQVAVDTASAYYQLVAQNAFVEVARAGVARAAALHEAAEAKLAAGLVSQLDVLRARQLRADAGSQLDDSMAAVDESRDTLLLTMGAEPGEELVLDAAIPIASEIVDIDSATATALASRPELRDFADALRESTDRLAVSRNQQLPQFDLNVAMTRRRTAAGLFDSFGGDGFRLATFFTLGMPVDRATQSVEIQRAQIERGQRERERATVMRQLRVEIRREVRAAQRLARAVAAAENSVALSRQEVEVAQLRFDRGLSNNLDLVAAEGELLAAQGRRLAALAQSAVQQLKLKAAMGVLDPVAIGEVSSRPPPSGSQ